MSLAFAPRSQLIPHPKNAFFTELGINPTPLMAVDLMHDVELGFGKGIPIHILRLLQVLGQSSTDEFDAQLVHLLRCRSSSLPNAYTGFGRSQHLVVTQSENLVGASPH